MRIARPFLLSLVSILFLASAYAQNATTADTAAKTNTSYIDPQGTAHVTRIVPVPKTISPEAQKSLARPVTDEDKHQSLADRRTGTDKWQNGAGEVSKQIYPANVAESTIASVPVRIITPLETPAANQDKVLINLHGGGFNSDSGSLTETIPLANLTKTKVIAVLYRLAPEHPFPAGLDDAVTVYKEMLKTYKPANIGVYGTSAGAILTGELAVRLKELNLPEPGALGIFSGMGDFSRAGDSVNIYALNGFSGYLKTPVDLPELNPYAGSTPLTTPALSPVFANLSGLPPTLFITSTRDLLLSGTTTLHRAFLRAGVPADLVVFEALPHAFWNDPKLPESKEADHLMAEFFEKHLGR